MLKKNLTIRFEKIVQGIRFKHLNCFEEKNALIRTYKFGLFVDLYSNFPNKNSRSPTFFLYSLFTRNSEKKTGTKRLKIRCNKSRNQK